VSYLRFSGRIIVFWDVKSVASVFRVPNYRASHYREQGSLWGVLSALSRLLLSDYAIIIQMGNMPNVKLMNKRSMFNKIYDITITSSSASANVEPVTLSRPQTTSHLFLGLPRSLRIMNNSLFLLEQVTSLSQNPLSWRTRDSFPYTGCLPWLTSPVYPPRNPGTGPLPTGPVGPGARIRQGCHSL
jgi:hypothetical protein